MGLALQQAKRILGNTKRNPAVGCIKVKKNVLLSLAHTCLNGRPHAERIALSKNIPSYQASAGYIYKLNKKNKFAYKEYLDYIKQFSRENPAYATVGGAAA